MDKAEVRTQSAPRMDAVTNHFHDRSCTYNHSLIAIRILPSQFQSCLFDAKAIALHELQY